MGCFDTISIECQCPKCGKIADFDFITKDLDCMLQFYDEGDKVCVKDEDLVGTTECDCGCVFHGLIKIDKFGRIDKVLKVSK